MQGANFISISGKHSIGRFKQMGNYVVRTPRVSLTSQVLGILRVTFC